MASGISDSERRSEIARRTRMGLEEDLEDLRSQLAEDLEWYERRIREVSQRAPGWTSVDPGGVVDLFEIEGADLPEEGFLGPRMVAIAAEAADEFVRKWMPGEQEEGELREQGLDEFERDLRELLGFVDGLGNTTDRRADRAHRILEEWMEANLAHLDELRENDLDALRELVGEGALQTGPDARAEKAQLWDEQRRRADELREIWDEFHDLVDDGAAYTHQGLEDVAALAGRACEGLEGAHAELEERNLSEELFEEGDDETADSPERGGLSKTEEIPPPESKGAGADGSNPRRRWLRSAGGEQEANERDGGAGAETRPLRDPPDEPTSPAGVDRDASDDPGGAAAEGDGGVSPTEPMVGSGTDRESTGDESSAGSTTESGGEDDGTGASRAADDDPKPGAAGARADLSGDSTGGAERVDSGGGFDPDEAASVDWKDETRGRASETIRSTCLRIRTEWRAVGFGAILAAFGPPVGFLIAMIGVSLAKLAGVEGAVNPVATWGWAEPAIGVALAWCLCTPLLLGWRPRWTGWSFRFVHRTEVRDDATVEIGPDGLSLGRLSFRWEAIDAYRVRRWEATDDDLVGWLLIVEPKYSEPVQLIAAEPDREAWERSSEAVVEPPNDAWQLGEEALEALLSRMERIGIDASHLVSESPGASTTSAPAGPSK